MSSTTRYFPNSFKNYDSNERPSIEIDSVFWKNVINEYANDILKNMPPVFKNCDGGLYVGCAGIAYMFFYLSSKKLFRDESVNFLARARNYADVSLSYSMGKRKHDPSQASSFLLDNGGVYAICALVFNSVNQQQLAQEQSNKYLSLGQLVMPQHFLHCGSDELFVGRAGYLCGAKLLRRNLGNSVIPDNIIDNVCNMIVQSGRHYSHKHNHRKATPLMFAYYDTEYLGAAHGLSSILQMLLSFPKWYKAEDNLSLLKECVDFLISLIQTNGNIAASFDEVNIQNSSGSDLVHWCHGTPGIFYLFAKSWLIWKDENYLKACINTGELVWRKGLLKKGPGICHGVAGSGYVFLILFRLTNDEKYLYRALKFAEFLLTPTFKNNARTPDSPFSLFEGLAGTVCFLADLLEPSKAEFPFFDIFD